MNEQNNIAEENGNLLNNNEANNNNTLYNNEEYTYSQKYTKITLSFILMFLLKFLSSLYITYNDNIDKFAFDFHFIINYNQYYRLITRFFISHGFAHFLLELYLLYKFCFYFENMLGTLFTINLLFISFILISAIELGILHMMIYLIKILERNNNLDIYYEGGFTPVLFFLYSFYFCFEGNNSTIFFLLIIFIVKARNSEFLFLLILLFFTPNETFLGNLSGIIAANILMKLKIIFLPRIIWIKHFETQFKFNKLFPLYRYINEENPIMKKILREYDKSRKKYDTDNRQQMTELTLLSNENEENNDNHINNGH
jgi:membrane associated rhomboid family serine protease